MTKEEYYNRLDILHSEMSVIKNKISELKKEYMVSLNAPYKHLIGKKVVVTYKGYFDDSIQVYTCYWAGYSLNNFGDIKPTFKMTKKDGTMSSREECLYVKEIVSMDEVG